MRLNQKNKKIAAGAIIVFLVFVLIWFASHNGRMGTGQANEGTAVSESTPAGLGNEDIREGDQAGSKTDKTSDDNQGKDSGTDSREDGNETADDTTILENEGDLEIVIPDDMGTDGF